MTAASVLRIGPFDKENERASQLRHSILQHFDSLRNTTNESNSERALTTEHQFCIANRYFTAQIVLANIGDDTSSSSSWTEDGIILVFDLRLSSFDALHAVHEQAEASGSARDLLRLCVGVGDRSELLQTMSEKEYEKEYSRRVLWCLDRGYEYVEADLSEHAVTQGHDVRDKDGFARIVEAVAGTVWSSAVMEKRKQQELKESYVRDSMATNGTSSDGDLPLSDAGTYEPPDPSSLPPLLSDKVADLERERLARDALLAEESSAVVESEGLVPLNNQREDVQQERAMNALEDSLHAARRLREQSIAGELSDEERRKRAGDAAVLIMNMMEQMGFDEEDSLEDEDNVAVADELVDAH